MTKNRIKKLSVIALLLLLTACLFAGCAPAAEEEAPAEEVAAEPVELNISAAASLTEALTEIQAQYESESGNTLLLNFGSSGTLQKQIEEGAPCDLYISASEKHMDALADADLIVADTRTDLLGNTLTLIASAEKAETVTGYEALTTADVESIAIGTPESVPAGQYAQEALTSLAIWDQVQAKIILAKDVKQVLEYVETGNTDCGIVYGSDALQLTTGKVVCELPEDSHSPIVYPVAVMANAAQPEAAAGFYDFLMSDFAASVFEKYGFTVL